MDPRQLPTARLRAPRRSSRSDERSRAAGRHEDRCGDVAVRGAGRTLTFTITVYALDQSVRGAYLDRQRGYFNGPCVFALPEGRDAEPIEVTLEPPPQPLCEDWRVATALAPGEIDERGFGVYQAQDYDELLDHPVEIGEHERVEFEAGGVPHHLVVAGRFESDLERVAVDLKQL